MEQFTQRSVPRPPPIPSGARPTDDAVRARVRADHAAFIETQIVEMRRCLMLSEKVRDKYYGAVAYWQNKGYLGVELDIQLKNDAKAQKNISDSQLYDRWTTKYAAVVAAEIAAYELGIHPEEYHDRSSNANVVRGPQGRKA